MTQKEYEKEHQQVMTARELETTQLVSLDDLKELKQLQLARVAAAEPQRQRRAVIAAGAALGLVLATALLAVAVLRSRGYF